MYSVSRLLLVAILLSVMGCSYVPDVLKYEEPLRQPIPPAKDSEQLVKAEQAQQAATRFNETPAVPGAKGRDSVNAKALDEPELKGKPVNVNIQNLPLPAFINEIYGNLLGLSFEIDKSLQNTKDLVTLRITEPQPLIDLFRTARQVLSSYGVDVQKVGGLYRFARQRGGKVSQTPLLVSGRNLPNVPETHRPVFQFVPLNVVTNSEVSGWLRDAYKSPQLRVAEDPKRNAIVLQGPPEAVSEAIEAIKLLDRPSMRGRNSVRIEPIYVTPQVLVRNLIKVLRGEGYAASENTERGSVSIIPLEDVNAIVAFASDRRVLEHIKKWVLQLDQPVKGTAKSGIFFYSVQNTNASELAEVLGSIIDGITPEPRLPPQVPPTGNPATAAPNPGSQANVTTVGRSLVVDSLRNAILFKGKPEEWARLLPVIRDLDKAPKQVLIEVTVAQITLTDDENLGVELVVEGLGLESLDGTGVTQGLGATSPTGSLLSGFNLILNNAGATRAVLNAFAANSRLNVISSPRVMVRSGTTASIDVGAEIPIITSQGTSPDLTTGGSSAILQSVQYRRTGTLLSVTPVVHAGRRVDLEVSQEVSSATVNQTSGISSPVINTSNVATSLSLSDGGSVLLGGLINTSVSQGENKVPLLGDIPGLGALFRAQSENKTRTELIILITPYIVESHEEAQSITEAFRSRLGQTLPVPQRRFQQP